MATGKTDSKYVVIIYGGQTLDCSIQAVDGVGITYDQSDVTGLCNTIKEFVQGQGDVSVTLSGTMSNTATTGSHTVIEPLNGDQTGSTLTVQYGIRAAPTTGDPEFNVTAMGVFDYLVSSSGGAPTFSASLRPLTGATASWTTV